MNPADSSTTESAEDPATAEAERQTEKATLATLGNTNHPSFAQEMKLLTEMLETAEWARHQPDEKLKKLFGTSTTTCSTTKRHAIERRSLEQPPHSDLHRIRRHPHIRPAPARGPYPIFERFGPAISRLQRIDLARRTPGNQRGLQRRPRGQPGAHPAGNRRGPRGT